MRPVEDQTILVTGATDGLGRALARELATRGATVLLHGRSKERLEDARRELQEATGSDRLRTYLADFASLEQVRRLAREVAGDQERLDVLVNNAGIAGGGPRQESAEGYELRFAVNYLAPFLLTDLLLPLLRRSAPARIVNVASVGQVPIDFDDVMLERGYDPMRAYRQSKLAQVMFTFELAERLGAAGESGVTVNALHPATLMNTKMALESFGYTISSIQDGVEATLRLVVAPELDGVSGRYFDRLDESRANPQAYEADARRRLWRLSAALAGLDEDRAERQALGPTGG
ncbi:MAG TPA: SDR family NAD(P)-dependent oxidoreductase [Actinomycetes bacterium]|jgi:NAD(P)-dependent dehydrogenase (short-subunit alcohol dehydrogenase family)